MLLSQAVFWEILTRVNVNDFSDIDSIQKTLIFYNSKCKAIEYMKTLISD